jgi:hypothetical protein
VPFGAVRIDASLFQARLEGLELLQDRSLPLNLFELGSLEDLSLALAVLEIDDSFELRG